MEKSAKKAAEDEKINEIGKQSEEEDEIGGRETRESNLLKREFDLMIFIE